MVNGNRRGAAPGRGLSTRAFILRELRKDPGAPVSGEELAGGLGVSRVAVWKGVRSLVAAGYPVESGESGYRLPPAWKGDFIYPWEFGEREARFRYFKTTGSTMDRARELAEPPASGEAPFPAGTVIAAEVQSAGRGRRGRSWASPPGGLFFTILEKPDLGVADYPLFSMAVQIGAAKSAAALCGREVRLRWPNDVYAGPGKVAGVLTELSGEGDRLRWISCGVGLNVNSRPGGTGAASCAEIAGRTLSRREGLRVFLDEFEKLEGEDPGEICRLWNSLAGGIGAAVKVIGADHGEGKEPGSAETRGTGVFAGVDPRGRCVIRNGNGEARYSPGAVSLIYQGGRI
jgi:BirA family biotin operon repressor/biotin-[acetyl-CoA-carboxylase] ligase